jgi:hypothetical protein
MLTLGSLLVCGALLAFAGVATVFRRPDPPRWTTWSDGPITIAVIFAFGLGLAYFINGASRAYQEGVSLVDLALFVVVLAATFVIGRGLRRRAQPKAAPTGRVAMATEPPAKPAPRAA